MRLLGSAASIVLLAVAMITGCGGSSPSGSKSATGNGTTAPPTARNSPPDSVRRVTVTELRDALDQGKAVVVDVRGDAPYNQEHIKGALNIAENQLAARSGELPKDKLIVFYCS